MPLLQRVKHAFLDKFSYAPELSVQAPGRVNLIGEHTDYNEGFVLPCAINYRTIISGARRNDRQVRVLSRDYLGETDEFSLDAPIRRHPSQHWANYVRGVVKGLVDAGYAIGGADIAISGNIPQGAGLSSSASLEVATAQFFKSLFNLDLPPTKLAQLSQLAENRFVGCQCGIMDQLISAHGQTGHALLMDCRSLALEAVALPADTAIVIVNSNVQRGLVDSEYNARRLQCEEAAKFFKVKALRDVDMPTLRSKSADLTPKIARRARHIISDSQRAIELSQALRQGDFAQISQLMADSHASMQGDFEITIPPIDALVSIIHDVLGKQGGVRMTGGGFGGCVVALMPSALAPAVQAAVTQHYPIKSGLNASVYVCQAAAGAGELR